ncbi:MAG: FAD-dependent oxidoreductase [Pseudomonadota bacterium]
MSLKPPPTAGTVDETMAEKRFECDVAVIGGGIAGMVTAVRAAHAGRSVRVFEKSSDDRYLCNSRITAGVFHCALSSIRSEPQALEDKIIEVTDGTASPALARAVATDALRAVRWLQAQGIRFISGTESYHDFTLSPPTITPQGRQWEGRGGDVLLRTLEANLKRAGGSVERGMSVRHLNVGEGRCLGLSGVDAAGAAFAVVAESIVIADGGFQADPDALREAITPAPEKIFQRNARSGTGDGLRMARAAGAAISDLQGFYGHLLSIDAFHNETLWPYGWLDFVAAAGILVGRDGVRFCDEGLGGVHMANRIAALEDPLSCFVIADHTIWETRGRFNLLPPNPRLLEAGGSVFKAHTLPELAAAAGIDADGLVAQIARYNEAVTNSSTQGLDPVRSANKFAPHPIVDAQYYAFPVCAGITYTMGGIAIDDRSRVLDTKGNAIAGLYAVGATTGGLEGGARTGYVGGLIKSAVTGLRAAETIAASA